MSTLLSTPNSFSIGEAGDRTPLHLDIGMGGHFEGFGGCKKEASTEIEALLMLL
jgi:hypothetical protein